MNNRDIKIALSRLNLSNPVINRFVTEVPENEQVKLVKLNWQVSELNNKLMKLMKKTLDFVIVQTAFNWHNGTTPICVYNPKDKDTVVGYLTFNVCTPLEESTYLAGKELEHGIYVDTEVNFNYLVGNSQSVNVSFIGVATGYRHKGIGKTLMLSLFNYLNEQSKMGCNFNKIFIKATSYECIKLLESLELSEKLEYKHGESQLIYMEWSSIYDKFCKVD